MKKKYQVTLTYDLEIEDCEDEDEALEAAIGKVRDEYLTEPSSQDVECLTECEECGDENCDQTEHGILCRDCLENCSAVCG